MGGVIWFLFGYYHASHGNRLQDETARSQSTSTLVDLYHGSLSIRPEFVLSFLVVVVAVGAGLIVNQIFDREVDVANAKPLPLVDGSVTLSHAWIELIVLLMVAAVGSAFLSASHFVLFVLTTIIGFSYSIPPLRFKARPILDASCFAVTYGLLVFLFGWISWRDSVDATTIQTALPYILLAFVIHVLTAIEDASGDKNCNCRTTPVTYGTTNVILLSCMLLIANVAMSVCLMNAITLIISLISLPFCLYALARPNLTSVRLLCRVLGLLSLGIPFLLFPWLGIFFLLMLCAWGKIRFGSMRGILLRRR